ncbi:MAG: phage integrase N-terminal SAM-like domain-containing protein [Planctomycetota bacterium]|nr:phage integrase N-terminal SAM-like domain-containing protein [Planctomycetota bacterium]
MGFCDNCKLKDTPRERTFSFSIIRRFIRDSFQQKLDETLQLASYSDRSCGCYVRQLRMFEAFSHKPAIEVTEDALKQYLVHHQNVSNWSAVTMRIAIAGLRQVFDKLLGGDWPALEYVRAPSEAKLPVVLSVERVSRIISSTRTLHNSVTVFGQVLSSSQVSRQGRTLRLLNNIQSW